MLKKILIFIIIGAMVFIVSGCKKGEEAKTVEIPSKGTYSRYVEVEEREPYNVIDGAVEILSEDALFEFSDLIFKGTVIDAKEIGIEEYIDGELYYIHYSDVFTFEVEKIYYSEGPSLEAGDVIKVANGSCSNFWIEGTIKMEKDKQYIVLAVKEYDQPNVEYTKYDDYYTTDHLESIILVEDGKYYVDKGLISLTGGAEEEIIREEGYFETTVYVKGAEFEQELSALILEKKGES